MEQKIKDEDQADHVSISEWIWVVFVSIVVVALWALDKYYEERVTEQEAVEYRQRMLSQPKFTEM